MKYKLLVLGLLFTFAVSILSFSLLTSAEAKEIKSCDKHIDFYYNPSCPHCQEVFPLIKKAEQYYPEWKFNYYDVSQKSYEGINGVPTIKIHTSDGRTITYSGSADIPKYLPCELEEKSLPQCQTYSITEGTKDGSWFKK